MRVLASPVLQLLAAVLAAAPARAADPASLARGIDPLTAKPSVTFDGFAVTEGARTEPAHSRALGLGLDFASGLMALQMGDARVGALIAQRLDLHLLGSYALTDALEVGVDLPLTAWQRDGLGTLQAQTGYAAAPVSHAGLGDLRTLGKLRLLDAARAPVGLAVIGEVRWPTGAEASFLGERGFVLAPRAALERAFGEDLRVALELGYRYRTQPGQYFNLYVGDELTASLAASYRIARLGAAPVTAIGELVGATPARAPFPAGTDSLKSSLEAMIGARMPVARDLVAQAGGATGVALASGFGRESFRLFASIRYARVFHDRDGDGIADEDDRCPDDPEDFDGFEDWDGCPDPDNDKDGIPDVRDRCPDVPGLPEYDGCPDRDGDDVPDPVDRCPDQPGPASNDGCPVERPYAIVERNALVFKGAVNFDSGKATLKPGSNEVLDDVATALRAHPSIGRVRVEGHTDNVGGAAFNLELSRRRAETVVAYLAAHGIAPARLESEGYGLERPIASNAGPLGRAKNRRVDFSVVGPSGAAK